MPEGSFELREVGWTPTKVAVAGLMLVVATLHMALATSTEEMRYAVLALGLLVLFVIYFTDVWQPVYHLYGALYVVLMAAVWFVSGSPMETVGWVDTVLKAALVALFGYRLLAGRRNVDAGESEAGA